ARREAGQESQIRFDKDRIRPKRGRLLSPDGRDSRRHQRQPGRRRASRAAADGILDGRLCDLALAPVSDVIVHRRGARPAGTRLQERVCWTNKPLAPTLHEMTKQARWSYVVLALTVVLIGFLQLGGPFLALLFSYLVLTKLGRYIPNKWVTLAIFIMIWVAIGFVAGHFVRAAINALPTIADNSVPPAIAWAEAHHFTRPVGDFEGLKATAMTTLKDQAKYLGDFANFARHASTTVVFILIAIVCAVSIFFNSRLDLFRESHTIRNNLYSVYSDEITARFAEFY